MQPRNAILMTIDIATTKGNNEHLGLNKISIVTFRITKDIIQFIRNKKSIVALTAIVNDCLGTAEKV